MNNDVLANLLRPQSFAEIVGQEAIVSILSRQAATKKIKHVYIYSVVQEDVVKQQQLEFLRKH